MDKHTHAPSCTYIHKARKFFLLGKLSEGHMLEAYVNMHMCARVHAQVTAECAHIQRERNCI